jgi:hypothetical protein
MPQDILHILRSLRTQFLLFILPFFLLGITFWFGGEVATKQLLSRPYGTLDKLEADTQLSVNLKLNLAVHVTDIEKDTDLTQVEVEIANSVLKRIVFQIPNTPSNSQEVMLMQQLGVMSKGGPSKKNKAIMIELPITVQVIQAKINKNLGVSHVKVMTAGDLLSQLEFEFPVTEVNMIEAMIAQELGLSRRDISQLVRYQIK